ncbi:hypothetical protein C0993_001635 [Termitomyces sp. T159_Od127]|nr:hypothetical protein C0993_001635 [Termitomyces sp. T159_Od127]
MSVSRPISKNLSRVSKLKTLSRRGSQTSSCARILIIHPDMHHITPPPPPPAGYFQPLHSETLTSIMSLRDVHLHNTIMPLLKERGLAFAPRINKWCSWTGILRLPKRGACGEAWETSRQMLKGIKNGDGEFVRGRIFLLPSKSRGAAMLFYTGSQVFLRLVKYKAAQLGLYFDQTGLWRWHPAPSEETVGKVLEFDYDMEEDEEESKPKPIRGGRRNLERELVNGRRANGFWQLLPSTNEEVILEQLGIDYVIPERRK